MRRFLLCVAAAGLLPFVAFADEGKGKALQIINVTPSGDDVPAGTQMVIQFNRPVVALGKMERSAAEIPVIITPALPCEWRWLNTSALACNLPDKTPMSLATHYTVEIKPGIAALDGGQMEEVYVHNFITQRPKISYSEFRQWKSASLPLLRLVFDQPVDKASVQEHVFLSVGDEGEGARAALKVFPDPRDKDMPMIMPVPGEAALMVFAKQPKRKSDEQLQVKDGREARRIWLVEPTKALPLDSHVILKAEPGLASPLGTEKSADAQDVVAFDTYPSFAFLGVSCRDNNDKPVLVLPHQSPMDKCNPMRAVDLTFSSPVETKDMGRMLSFTPAVGGWGVDHEEYDAFEERDDMVGYIYRQPHSKGRVYSATLPYGLKAAQVYSMQSRAASMHWWERLWHWLRSLFVKTAPADVRDIFGRELSDAISVQFETDHRNPNFVLDYRDAVLEAGIDSEVPLYVNNLESYRFDYRMLTAAGGDTGLHYSQKVPGVRDVQFAVPLGVRAMLSGKSGAVFGSLTTQPFTPGMTSPRLFAQVTPYQVHVKLGHFSSLVWVTDMTTGAPVAGAKVMLFKQALTMLGTPDAVNAQSMTDDAGVASLPGTAVLDPELELRHNYRDEQEHLFVQVTKSGTMALVPLDYDFLINSYRASGSEAVYATNLPVYGHIHSWGTTAQGVYRAGDTIQYKLYVRNQDDKGFVPAPRKGYTLRIIDPMGKVVEEVPDVVLSEFGGYSGEFEVPKTGAVGWYQFVLEANFASKADSDADVDMRAESGDDGRDDTAAYRPDAKSKSFTPMRVLVSDFTPSSFRVRNQLNGDRFKAGQQVEVRTNAELHSGGAYTDASARVTAILDSASFVSKNPAVQGFQFDSYENEMSSQQLFQKIDKVNDKGELALGFPLGTPKIVFGKLSVESAVADDRGKFVSTQARVDYVGVDRLVGLKSTEWLYTVGKPAVVQYAVVDADGNPAAGTDVALTVERQVSKAAKVKGAGNAYLTEYHTEWENAGSCKGSPKDAPLDCSFTPDKAGVYRVVASIKDTQGNDHSTTLSLYATGSGYVVWGDESDTSLTIVPEKTDYKVGDTARFLVKNPYPGAKALITVERYGVIEHFVQTFDSSTPVVELKVKPDYLPGFYLSVVVTSPRVEKPLGEGQVDLGKPAMRMGYLAMNVKDPYKEMLVTATSDKPAYKPREKVTVRLHVEPRMNDKKEKTELMIAVLDESVFDLISGGKSYFDPYAGFYKLDNLDLQNYNLLTRLVGRQKFEKKGANPGGDGGADLSMRSLFKFVSYWNASLVTDKDGNATVSFDAPDNLTGWRILAIATTPSDRFGLGDANFKVNKPTETRAVMPNQVMEGDNFDAGFSVMNRTDKTRTLQVSMHVSGDADSKTVLDVAKEITLAPYKREVVKMPVLAGNVAKELAEGKLHFSVQARDALDADGMVQDVPVHKRRNLDVAANYGTTTEAHVEEPVHFPEGMLTDVGDVSVVLAPSVIGNITGAFGYMRDYPYMCWEQRLSKGMMASHYGKLKPYLPEKLTWEESADLPQRTLDDAASFQAPNGGMTYFVAEDQYVDPYLSAYTALAFNWLRDAGYKVPEPVETKLHTYLSGLLKNDAVPDFYSAGMTSTVRAVALAALAQQGKADLADLTRYWPHVKSMSLLGKSYFLQAAMAVKGGEQYLDGTAKMILAASNETAGKFMFNEAWDDSYSRVLATPLRDNCAVLDAFTAFSKREEGKALVNDVPFKLVRSITQSRKNKDHWENTQENLFCMQAMVDYAKAYESEKPAMEVTAAMDGEAFGKATFKDVRDNAATLTHPVQSGDAGRKAVVQIDKEGAGRLYYSTRVSYAMPVEGAAAAISGIEITREYSVQREGKWQMLEAKDGLANIRRGELVRVDLYVSVPSARNFVVVDDAVPGGLEPVNRDLATASTLDAAQGEFQAAGGSFWFKYSDWQQFGVSRWSFYHQELRHDSARFYSDYLPAGHYHLSYAAQAVATGSFSVLPAVAQEMYDPDVYGKTTGLKLTVGEADAP